MDPISILMRATDLVIHLPEHIYLIEIETPNRVYVIEAINNITWSIESAGLQTIYMHNDKIISYFYYTPISRISFRKIDVKDSIDLYVAA